MADLGNYQSRLDFDYAVAAGFQSSCLIMADAMSNIANVLWSCRITALEAGFRGLYADMFYGNGQVIRRHALRLTEAFEELSPLIGQLRNSAEDEDVRRNLLRAWEQVETAREVLHDTVVAVGGEFSLSLLYLPRSAARRLLLTSLFRWLPARFSQLLLGILLGGFPQLTQRRSIGVRTRVGITPMIFES